jgi:hypothetical protein
MLDKLEALLIEAARQKNLLTYQQVAKALELEPPHVIHQTAESLEALMRIHAQAGAPQLASLVVGRARAELPAPGYFILLNELGLYQGSVDGEDARHFHAAQKQRCYDVTDEDGEAPGQPAF